MTEFTVKIKDAGNFVSVVEFNNGERNYFNLGLIDAIASAMETARARDGARAIVLASDGPHFCAGADFNDGPGAVDKQSGDCTGRHLYDAAQRLFEQPLPVIASVQGAAIGGGLGLAMSCDFRIAADNCRFAAPFSRLGLHHGFGLTVTLPLAIGHQNAISLLYTGRRIKADEALALGICDQVVSTAKLRERSVQLAREIASAAPIAVQSIRKTMRGPLTQLIQQATDHEKAEQALHKETADFREGVRADIARELPTFIGR